MRILLLLIMMLTLAGCLTSSVPTVTYWPIGYVEEPAIPTVGSIENAPSAAVVRKYGVVRISQVIVRSPYDADRIQVLRADGSVGFDEFNRWTCLPSLLMKGSAIDAVHNSKKFQSVIWPSSSVRSECALEIEIRKLALDCRTEGKREAVVSVATMLIDRQHGIIATATADGVADAVDGNFGKAFSQAYSQAISATLRDL